MSLQITKMLRCPFCRARMSLYERACTSCGEDLSLIADLHLMPYVLYNQAVALYSEGDLLGAMRKLSAAVELAQEPAKARELLKEVLETLGLSRSTS